MLVFQILESFVTESSINFITSFLAVVQIWIFNIKRFLETGSLINFQLVHQKKSTGTGALVFMTYAGTFSIEEILQVQCVSTKILRVLPIIFLQKF